ncbi:MAG: hypothetical protein ACRCTY_08010, partial [Candidatus Adiutrix sp.]
SKDNNKDIYVIFGGGSGLNLSVAVNDAQTAVVVSFRYDNENNFTSAKAIIDAINSHPIASRLIRAEITDGDGSSWTVANSGGSGTLLSKTRYEPSAKHLIEYILGEDKAGWRSRQAKAHWDNDRTVTWRLGTVINSQPVIVGTPFSGFDLRYGDKSYARYKSAFSSRRHMAYFGANDGMLHALNLGFYGSLRLGQAGYSADQTEVSASFSEPSFNPSGTYSFPSSPTPPAHPLGKELWGFIPQSVLPHLQWLADTQYNHSYYLDIKPTIVEIKNTSLDGTKWSRDEWRTVLICGLRLGGRSIQVGDTEGDGDTGRHSYSEVFALDITNPEEEPTLLWRFSAPDLGMVTSPPVVVRNNAEGDMWYVIVGSGPNYDDSENQTVATGANAYKGYSNQAARFFILDAVSGQHVRTLTSDTPRSFVSSSMGLAAPASTVRLSGAGESATWSNQVAYFGLTQATSINQRLDGEVVVKDDEADGYLHKGGLYRISMVGDSGAPTGVNSWRLNRMFDTDRPITGPPNATYDNSGNLWLVFGTGRLWSEEDTKPCLYSFPGDGEQFKYKECQTNHLQFMYGLKEPSNGGVRTFTADLTNQTSQLRDVTNVRVYSHGHIDVNTNEGGVPYDAGPDKINTYLALQNYIRGGESIGWQRALKTDLRKLSNLDDVFGSTGVPANQPDAWWRDITYEMNLHQVALDGLPGGMSNMIFTTYVPSFNPCSNEGHSYMYIVDAYTGLPRPDMAAYGSSAPWLGGGATGHDLSDNLNTDGDLVTGQLAAG